MNTTAAQPGAKRNGAINTLQKEDLPIHGWYRFVLSYPPHLVRQYLAAFELAGDDLVLDPFCGTGTTLVEARMNRIASAGCESHLFLLVAPIIARYFDAARPKTPHCVGCY